MWLPIDPLLPLLAPLTIESVFAWLTTDPLKPFVIDPGSSGVKGGLTDFNKASLAVAFFRIGAGVSLISVLVWKEFWCAIDSY